MKQTQEFNVTLTAAQLRALSTTPVPITITPRPNQILIPWLIIAEYHPGSVPFSEGKNMKLKLGAWQVAGLLQAMGGNLARAIQMQDAPAYIAQTVLPIGDVAGMPLTVETADAGYTDGDGSITFHVRYWFMDV